MRRTHRSAVAAIALAAAATAGTLPAFAAAKVLPRNGSFTGTEAGPAPALPVSFTVVNRKKVTAFEGTAVVKDGCPNAIQSYQTPQGPFKISANGSFTGASTDYPKPAPTVRVTGRFVSRTQATGVITIKFAKKKGCNASQTFTATLQP